MVLQPVEEIALVLGGDFNSILSSTERVEGSCPRTGVSHQFGDFIQNSRLNDFGFQGQHFTWKQGTLHQRIGSDHRPLLLGTDLGNAHLCRNSFKYLAAWQLHSGFNDMLMAAWKQKEHAVYNIECFQKEASIWNRETFGHIGRRKS
ncbi:hypothetical protein V6N13_148991 [Hibiscus sabdariffa]